MDTEQLVKTIRGTSVRLLHPIYGSSGAIEHYMVLMASGNRCVVDVNDLVIKDPKLLKQIQKGKKDKNMNEQQKAESAVKSPPILNPVLPPEATIVPPKAIPKAAAPVTPNVEVPKKKGTRRTKVQMAAARAAGTEPIKDGKTDKVKGTRRTKVQMAAARAAGTEPIKDGKTDKVKGTRRTKVQMAEARAAEAKEPLNITEPVAKKRGPKPKATNPVPVIKKKRGRPTKAATEAPEAPKRRGRPPKAFTDTKCTCKAKKGTGSPSKCKSYKPEGEITLSTGRGPVPQILKDNIGLVKKIGVISKDNKLAVALLKLLNANM
ncbi:hypothetical protein ACFLQL_00540 [Verrucomicrobiota bacterium]